MPRRQKKIKTCDPFCPQSRKDAEVKAHQPLHLPYNSKNDEKIPRSLRTLQFLMEQQKEQQNNTNKNKNQKKEENHKEAIGLSESKMERKENKKLSKQIKADEKELQRLLKEKARLEKMLK